MTHEILQTNSTLGSINVGNRTQPEGQDAQRAPSIPKTNERTAVVELACRPATAALLSPKRNAFYPAKNSALVSRGVGNRTQPGGQNAQRAPSTPNVKTNKHASRQQRTRSCRKQHAKLQKCRTSRADSLPRAPINPEVKTKNKIANSTEETTTNTSQKTTKHSSMQGLVGVGA